MPLSPLIPVVPGRARAEVSGKSLLATRNQWPIGMSARCRSNERFFGREAHQWMSKLSKSLFTNDLGFIPTGDWDLCIHIGIAPCSIGQNRWSYLSPQKRCRHVFPGWKFSMIFASYFQVFHFSIFFGITIYTYIYIVSRILERIALLDFTEPWIILNFPLILSSEFRIHLLCTSHWDCILTGWRLSQNRSMIHVCIYI